MKLFPGESTKVGFGRENLSWNFLFLSFFGSGDGPWCPSHPPGLLLSPLPLAHVHALLVPCHDVHAVPCVPLFAISVCFVLWIRRRLRKTSVDYPFHDHPRPSPTPARHAHTKTHRNEALPPAHRSSLSSHGCYCRFSTPPSHHATRCSPAMS